MSNLRRTLGQMEGLTAAAFAMDNTVLRKRLEEVVREGMVAMLFVGGSC